MKQKLWGMHRITALCWASETYIMYCIKRHALNDMHMDIAFPRLLCSFQVLSSPCYFTSARRTAAQVQLKYAFSCSTTPSSVLLVLWVCSDSFSMAESLGQCMIYLQRKVPLFNPSKSSSIPCFKLCLWSQIYQIWSLFTKFSQSRFVLLSFVFLENLQGEMWFWNVRTAHEETWTAEKSWTYFSEFLCTSVTYMTFLEF